MRTALLATFSALTVLAAGCDNTDEQPVVYQPPKPTPESNLTISISGSETIGDPKRQIGVAIPGTNPVEFKLYANERELLAERIKAAKLQGLASQELDIRESFVRRGYETPDMATCERAGEAVLDNLRKMQPTASGFGLQVEIGCKEAWAMPYLGETNPYVQSAEAAAGSPYNAVTKTCYINSSAPVAKRGQNCESKFRLYTVSATPRR